MLVGADGIWSRVRAQLHGDERPRYVGYTAWRGVIPWGVATFEGLTSASGRHTLFLS